MASAFRAASSETDLLACNTTVQCVVSNGAPPSCSVPGVGFVRPRSLTRSERVVERNRAGNEMFAEKNGRKIYEPFYRHPPSEDKKVKMRRPRKNCGRHRTISFPRLRFSCGSWIAAAAGRKLQKNLS